MYEFFCNTKCLLDNADVLLRQSIKTHGSENLPDDLNKMGLEIVRYKERYHKLLEAICDDLPKSI